jgi:transglutaminase-like putative cysteine protease
VSATADSLSILPAAGRAQAQSVAAHPSARARPVVRLLAFAALATYGALRWSVLLTPRPSARLLGVVALAVLAAGALPALMRRGRTGRALGLLGVIAVLLGALGLCGIPISLIRHAHVGAIANGIGQGFTALPRVTVPYVGVNDWARVVIMLGAAVLILDAGLVLGFAPAALGDARRAGAALPLIALAVVPSTLMRPTVPYLHGLVLLVLIAALVWGERLRRGSLGTAAVIVAAAGGLALAAAPAIDSHQPWVNPQSLAGAFSPSNLESFDWSQHYGSLNWPRTGREILDVKASRADYWKAENLDHFDGTAWVEGSADTAGALPTPASSSVSRWSQTLKVTLRGMQTSDIVAAGFAAPPQHVPTSVLLGDSPGTWTTSVNLGPGDSYNVLTYSPRPSPAELTAASHEPYPDESLSGYRAITLPATTGLSAPAQVVFQRFHANPAAQDPAISATPEAALMDASPYAGAYALARQLARASITPYDFVQNVERYLAHGFTYSENAPLRAYPLESFLFRDKRGYCQQFSGAMALLLRMGGVPARVAAGFTPGTYDPTAHQWVATDLDAHAWVEVWFPRFGWVRFDPTPSVAPALAGQGGGGALSGAVPRSSKAAALPKRRVEAPAPGSSAHAPVAGGSSLSPVAVAGLVLAALAVVFALGVLARGGPRSTDELVAELERALARSGRRLGPGATLAQLEQRLRSTPAAAGYVRALREARYAGATQPPTRAGRSALRGRLAEGLGALGRLRAWWALPPRRGSPALTKPPGRPIN